MCVEQYSTVLTVTMPDEGASGQWLDSCMCVLAAVYTVRVTGSEDFRTSCKFVTAALALQYSKYICMRHFIVAVLLLVGLLPSLVVCQSGRRVPKK